MAEVRFYGRYTLKNIKNPSHDFIEEIFLKELPIGGEWSEALIEYREHDTVTRVIVLADKTHGFCIKYIPPEDEMFLSLGDRDLLKITICPDDWEAALGSFISRKPACRVILDFVDTGKRSDAIEWILDQDLPDGIIC